MRNAEGRARSGVPSGWRMASVVALMVLLPLAGRATAQDNYEIQVYPSETMPRGITMFEFHTNFTSGGRTEPENGVWPTDHQIHETLEITHGFNDWFEVGLYTFTSGAASQGYEWVGEHIRPRFRIPQTWHWVVGVSVSQEFGYQRRQFSEDTWSYELRPIVDQTLGRWSWAVNPALELAVKGPNASRGFEFAPAGQVAYDVTPKVQAALEYYGGLGPISGFVPRREQGQQLFPAVNIDFGPAWEFNAGVGFGLTPATDHVIAKVILGYRLRPRTSS